MPADDPGKKSLRLILRGVAPALAIFLPNMVVDGAGLPFSPSTPELASLTDSMLIEFGKIAELQQLAELERYALSRSGMIAAV